MSQKTSHFLRCRKNTKNTKKGAQVSTRVKNVRNIGPPTPSILAILQINQSLIRRGPRKYAFWGLSDFDIFGGVQIL